jgi:hypothetical protein
MRRSGRRSEVERSERRKRHSLCDFAARWPNQGARCVSRSFRRPPGIALSAVPFVGDDIGRILRAHGRCYNIPTSAAISPFGARSSDGYLTSDAICPSAFRTSLKMNPIDHGVHSLLPSSAGAQKRLSVARAGWKHTGNNNYMGGLTHRN